MLLTLATPLLTITDPVCRSPCTRHSWLKNFALKAVTMVSKDWLSYTCFVASSRSFGSTLLVGSSFKKGFVKINCCVRSHRLSFLRKKGQVCTINAIFETIYGFNFLRFKFEIRKNEGWQYLQNFSIQNYTRTELFKI